MSFGHGAADGRKRVCRHHPSGGEIYLALGAMCLGYPALWRFAVQRIDVSDDRRTAESLLAIEAQEIAELVIELAKSKRLSIVMRNLNRLMQDPTDQELGRRALRHLGVLGE